MFEGKKIYYIDYSGHGHQEWNFFTDDIGLQELFNEINKYNLIKPDIWPIDVETIHVLLDFLGRLAICGFPAESVKKKLDEILEKLENC